MSIERARIVAAVKPWGMTDLHPWSDIGDGVTVIGELSCERADIAAPRTALLLKLLFTSAPLSIQVHPDDAQARSRGQPNGKSEAWHVLRSAPGAEVALGLKQSMTRDILRLAISNGSIPTLVDWQPVNVGDTILVPAGTVHAIGAGLIIAEIQQRSDTTFRLFDYGRRRALHIDDATEIAFLGPAQTRLQPERLSVERTVLACTAHFVFERIVLRAGPTWQLDAILETWLFVLDGSASAGVLDLVKGDAVFAQNEHVDIQVGETGVDCLVAYASGGANAQLLQRNTKSQCDLRVTNELGPSP